MAHLVSAVKNDSLVYLSGQLAFDENGEICGDIEEQTKKVLNNLAKVLGSHDAGLENIIRTNVYLTSKSNFQQFDETYAAMFGHHIPARSLIICDLVFDTALVEIDAIASIAK